MGKWLLGLIILAIAALLLSLFGPWSVTKHSKMMGDSISSALSAEQLDFVSVEMDGNVANLTGTAPSKALASQAVSVAQNVRCEKCKEKWHVVKSDIKVKELASVSPYTFDAVKADDGTVTLNGYVGSEDDRLEVLEKANALFPGQVVDETIRVASGAPNGEWGKVVQTNLEELALLDRGRFNMENNQTVISGLAANADVRTRINDMVGNLPEGYDGAANISVPDMAAVNVGEIKSESVCQNLLDDLKAGNKVNFATDKAEIRGANSFDLLNNLASAAVQCSAFHVKIEGHTDNVGADEYNQWLSEARANTVVAYLADNGVDIERMTAMGYGETKPVGDNETPEGRSRNRRIEFIVTQSE